LKKRRHKNILAAWKNRIKELRVTTEKELRANPLNWRTHPQTQNEALKGILGEVGIAAPLIAYYSEEAGGALTLIDGHLRLESGGEWPVAVLDVNDREAKLLIAVFDPISALAGSSAEILEKLLEEVTTSNPALQKLLEDISLSSWEIEPLSLKDNLAVAKDAKPNPRKLPLDVIYTLQGADVTCCLAVLAGLKYGIQSGNFRLCPYTEELSGRHEVCFIDNDYFAYDHTKHLETVKRFGPKYCTVRDVMTKVQCKEAGIEYYSLEKILDWAEELNEYAENVILIPKYDCLDKLPEKFMLGYSIPTSHGGTPLPVSLFKGFRVHLLGGSWKAQLAHLAELEESVVSLDNNQIALIASSWAQWTDEEGEIKNLTDMGLGGLNNPRYVALALSFGSIGAKLNELYKKEEE
jgi:hypothetical protein